MLIRAYAQFWNPDAVEWGSRGAGNAGSLLGTVKIDGRKREVDFWNQRGIYVLHDDFRPVYVGKASSQPLGQRLRDHLTDRFAGRWDMFSWFGLSYVKKTTWTLAAAGTRQVAPDSTIDTLEALAILIADPPLNRKRERLKNALIVEQKKSPHPRTIRHYLEEILKKV